MNKFLMALDMTAGGIWLSFAAGWLKPDPWVVTMAFIFLGLGALIDGFGRFYKETRP